MSGSIPVYCNRKLLQEVCQDSEGESRNVQKSETQHVVQKCKSADEPNEQVVSDDNYDVPGRSQNSQNGTMAMKLL